MKDGWFFLDCNLLNVKPQTVKLQGLYREIKKGDLRIFVITQQI